MNPLLQIIANNPALTQALQEELFRGFDQMEVKQEFNDELLGQITRARLVGKQTVEGVLRNIAREKNQPGEENKINPAR